MAGLAGLSILVKKRLLVMLMCFSFLISILGIRVFWIQIIRGGWFQQKAFEQQNRDREITPRRGTIYDRNGKVLAISASVEKISVNPQDIKKSKKSLTDMAQTLSEILNLDNDVVLKKITKSSRYEILKKGVEKEKSNLIRKWIQHENIQGVYIDEDTKRYYPNRNLAAQVIGFTGTDNQGLEGIEKMLDQYLRGVPGKILSEVDAAGHEIPFDKEKRIEPKDGLNVITTIDETIQSIVQKALDKAIDDNKLLNGACGIVMDPRNGEILAMASKPDFDLNDPKAAPSGINADTWQGNTTEDIKKLQETVWRNKALVDTYEPGSTFKAITSAAGLEENVVKPDTMTSDTTISLQGWSIKCWKPNAHGVETFTEGVYNSCNPVFVKVAQSLGIDRFYKYIDAFGFNDKTGICLPGEASSIIHKKPKEIDMACASFGQRLQITPIQLITAYAAIANGGKLLKPHVFKEMTDINGNIIKKIEPEIQRNVISKHTSDTLRGILEGVVSQGTGRNAYVKGYRVAGKTGTSETTEKGRYIASFSAFAPADNPVICVLVILDNPSGGSYYGGAIAAPVAGKIVEDTLSYLSIERRYTEEDKKTLNEEVFIPDVRGKTINEARKILTEYGLQSKIENEVNKENNITDQMPKPGVSIPKKSVVILYVNKNENASMVKVPDVKNKTVYDATDMLNKLGLNIKVRGIGTSFTQSIKPGEMVPKGDIITVEFRFDEGD